MHCVVINEIYSYISDLDLCQSFLFYYFDIDRFFCSNQFFDRLECLKLIQNGLADFAPFEPEDMYIAAKFMDDSLAIFVEMRNAFTQLGIHETG